MQCPRCEGTGTCAECAGKGKVVCPACDGKGQKVTPRGTTFDCKACAGTGQMDCGLKCASCEGTGQLTDQLRKKVREKYTPQFDNTNPLSRFSSALLAINLSIFLVQQLFGSQVDPVISKWAWNTVDGWTHGEIWRLILPIFLHGGWVHLGFNCWFLMKYCPALEGLYGSRRFLALYLIAGVVGNLFSWVGNCWIDHDLVAGIGASTSLFGVGAAYVAVHYKFGLLDRQNVQVWAMYLIGYLVWGFASHSSLAGPGIDNWGHLGGLVGGFLFVWLSPRPYGR